MGKYGNAAIKAVELIKSGVVNNPVDAWEKVTSEIFGKGSPSQIKGCPKNAFLGLCEDGLIKYILPGNYTRSILNKKYALKAINLLKNNNSLVNNIDELWGKVTNHSGKKYNQQMDVVTTLWLHDFIKK